MSIIPSTPEEEAQQHDRAGNDPKNWIRKADELQAGARILTSHCWTLNRPPNEVPGPTDPNDDEAKIFLIIHMLHAMAIECLLKGLWVGSGNSLAKGGEYQKVPGTNDHDLRSLADVIAKRIGISFSDDERVFLKRWSFLIIAGRYPVQKKSTALDSMPRPKGSGGKSKGYEWSAPRDENLMASIWSKMEVAYREKCGIDVQQC